MISAGRDESLRRWASLPQDELAVGCDPAPGRPWTSGDPVPMNRTSRPKAKRGRAGNRPSRSASTTTRQTRDKKKIALLTRELNEARRKLTRALAVC